MRVPGPIEPWGAPRFSAQYCSGRASRTGRRTVDTRRPGRTKGGTAGFEREAASAASGIAKRVRDLAPNGTHRLQRATDTVVDDDCTGTAWLTLGQGLTPHAIVTDDKGTGRADLWRILPASPGAEFDIPSG